MSCLGKVKKTKEFNRVYKKAKAIHTKYFIIFYYKNIETKLGVVASKKIGNAVYRNRAKRVLRAIFRENITKIKTGIFILIAKKDINNQKFIELNNTYKRKISNL